jgi:hypothetical protein
MQGSEGEFGTIAEVDDAVLEMIEWIKRRIRLKGCNVAEAWTEEHDGVAAEVRREARLFPLRCWLPPPPPVTPCWAWLRTPPAVLAGWRWMLVFPHTLVWTFMCRAR